MSEPVLVECPACRAANELPDEAVAVGQYRCHACGQVQAVPAELCPGRETPTTHDEPVQSTPSYVPSQYNTPDAMRRAEEEASRVGCLVALVALCR